MTDYGSRLREDERRVVEGLAAMRAKHSLVGLEPPYAIGAGWLGIVDEMFSRLVAAGWDREVSEVKSKYCGLRVYANASTAEQQRIISEAEAKAAESCERCGQPHGLSVPRSGRALCRDCRDIDEADVAEAVLSIARRANDMVRVDDVAAVLGADRRTVEKVAASSEWMVLHDDRVWLEAPFSLVETLPTYDEIHNHTVWHEHLFSPKCDNEVHGRFDAVESEKGECYVIDVGERRIVAACATREEAMAVAADMAQRWTLGGTLLERYREPSRPIEDVWRELGVPAPSEKRTKKAPTKKRRSASSDVDAVIAEGREDIAAGRSIGPFDNADDAVAALRKVDRAIAKGRAAYKAGRFEGPFSTVEQGFPRPRRKRR